MIPILLSALLLASSPAGPAADLTEAEAAFDEADFEGALRILDVVTASGAGDPIMARAHLLRARCFAAKGALSSIEQALTLALEADPEAELDPASGSPRVLGMLAYLRGNLRSALYATADRPGAVVRLEGKVLGAVPLRVSVPIGRHRFEVRTPDGRHGASRELVLRPGRLHEVAFELRDLAPGPPAPPVSVVEAVPPAPRPVAVKPISPEAETGGPVSAAVESAIAGGPAAAAQQDSATRARGAPRPFADLRAVGDPGKGVGFEIGAGVGFEHLGVSLHGVIGGYPGVTLRGTLRWVGLAAGLGAYGSLDVPVLFFVADASPSRAGGVMSGGGGAAGLFYAVTTWLEPFAEVAGRHFFSRPAAADGSAGTSLLIGTGLRVRLP